jgi:hypothetical protein
MQNVMTPRNPGWREFIYWLERAVENHGCGGDGAEAHHAHAKWVLAQRWPDVSIEESISFFRQNGGYCDCEVLLNVDRE